MQNATEWIPTSGIGDARSAVAQQPLHRLAIVRNQEGLSQRCIARRLNADTATIRQQEIETTDLQLSVLYQWQRALQVPVAELLVESDGTLSAPIMQRARMVKIMKTVETMMEKAKTPSMERLLGTLREELREVMPELTRVLAWPAVGERRSQDELGRTMLRQVPADLLSRRR